MNQQNDHIKNLLTLRYDPSSYSQDAKVAEDFKPTFRDASGMKLEQLLVQSLMDDIEDVDTVGIALSSGVDSMLLAKMIRELFPKKHMIAYHYCGVNQELDDVLKFCRKENIRLATIENFKLIENIPTFVDITGEPIWDGFNAPLYSEAKNDGCDVLVTGDGADETLGGYTFRYRSFNPVNTSVESQTWAYIDCHKRDWVEDQAQMFDKKMKFAWNDIMYQLIKQFDNDLTWMGKVFLADYNGKLIHNFLPRDRHFEDYYGIRKVAPFLDWRVEEFCCHLDYDNKIVGEVGKMPIRKIAERYGIFPTMKKLGFSHDVVAEWKKSQVKTVKSLMKGENQIFDQKIINREWLQRHVIKDSSDPRYVNKFMQLIALEYWLMMNQ